MQFKLPGENDQRNPTLNGSQDLLVSPLDPETLKTKSGTGTRRHRLEAQLLATAPKDRGPLPRLKTQPTAVDR